MLRILIQAIFDFDRTLTRATSSKTGENLQDSWGAILESKFIKKRTLVEYKKLFDFFYPIEQQTDLPVKEKEAAMVEWWSKALNLIVHEKITREQLVQMVQHTSMQLRAGVSEVFGKLAQWKVPILIFSAGILNVIDLFIHDHHLLTANVRVLSNEIFFDDHGVLSHFHPYLIHGLNKNGEALTNVFKQTWSPEIPRDHIILMGDNLEDISMMNGFNKVESLTIGFLNKRIKENLPKYLATYDLVIIDDASMELVNLLFDYIFSV